jgi:hypothetical protein
MPRDETCHTNHNFANSTSFHFLPQSTCCHPFTASNLIAAIDKQPRRVKEGDSTEAILLQESDSFYSKHRKNWSDLLVTPLWKVVKGQNNQYNTMKKVSRLPR